VHRGFIAEIDLAAISGNLSLVRRLSGSRRIIAVVKADAYGHGALEVSKRLINEGVDMLAVAFTDEARTLRQAGITIPILVLFDSDPHDIFTYGLTPVISDKRSALRISLEAQKRGIKVPVHIKVDTGMGRMGIAENQLEDILEISSMPALSAEGLMSHFSEADLKDPSFADMQIQKFNKLKDALTDLHNDIKIFHMANSAAVMSLPSSLFNAVRPGIMLYGYCPLDGGAADNGVPKKSQFFWGINHGLKPVMTVKSPIIAVRKFSANTPVSYGRTFITKRESIIAVMAAGYADGFNRAFSNNAEVIVNGIRVPVVGRVCMDLTMLDVTKAGDVNEGDYAVIIGESGSESISASELANRINTIHYEILTSIGSRAKRVYVQ
jgi:alanine racemase